jgi:hypothetical protein
MLPPLALAWPGTRHSPVPPALNTNADAVDTDIATTHLFTPKLYHFLV